MTKTRSRIGFTLLMAFAALTMALPAFAEPSVEDVAVTAITDAASTATGIVTAGIPIVLGVALLWVALKFGKRLIGRL